MEDDDQFSGGDKDFDGPCAGLADLVRLSDFDPRHPGRILGELRGYWDGLRRGRAIPTRADIDPRGLRGALGHAFILERIAPGAARFRLAGRHLIDLMGMEVRGMPLCSFFNPASRGRLSDVLETVFAGPQIVELTLLSEGAYARPVLPARMLLLPLRSDLGDITRALGVIVAESAIGRPPRRFDLTAEVLTPVIEGARTLAPAPGALGFGEPAPPPWRTPDPGRSPGLGRRPGRVPAGSTAGEPPTAARPALTAGETPGWPTLPASDPLAAPKPEPLPKNATLAERRARFRVIPGGS
ncbi:PAS domain-containing protein [Paracoccus suum]|uniref:PAS domain-containing protein n=2 Tax=Paracoccus suum TaxID=2259340 RepID=A0A344PKC6_9RHOB|nr:PAS domain-containing protein [Paracoccus suum]